MFCNKCGTQLPQNSKFCTACGAQCFVPDTPLPPPAASTPPPAPEKSYMQKLKDGIAQAKLPPQPSAAPPYELFTSPAVQEFAQKAIDKRQREYLIRLWLCLMGLCALPGVVMGPVGILIGLVVGTVWGAVIALVNRIPKITVHHYSIAGQIMPANVLQTAITMSHKSSTVLDTSALFNVPVISVLQPQLLLGRRAGDNKRFVVVFATTEYIDAENTLVHLCAIGREKYTLENAINRIVQNLKGMIP